MSFSSSRRVARTELITLSRTPGSVETLGPELGQDTEILLMELLEMEWEKIEELKAQGVIP